MAAAKGFLRPVIAAAAAPARPTLVDVPVSNHGARVRFLIYSKGLEDKIDIQPPGTFGGLKSEEYKKLHPKGKMPCLVLPSGMAIPESEAISQYISEVYGDEGPSFVPETPELRAKCRWITQLHDIYLSPIQDAMYSAMPPADRALKIGEINELLDIFEQSIEGIYAVGDTVTTADAAIFPTFTFIRFMLPKFFGWDDVFKGRPKLQAWWDAIVKYPNVQRVVDEIEAGLRAWEEKGRWVDLGIIDQVKDKNFVWVY